MHPVIRLSPFALALALLPASAQAAAGDWTVSSVTRNVVVKHAGTARPARLGMHVAPGDMLMTGGNARVMLVRGEDYAVVAPNSTLTVGGDAAAVGGGAQFFEKFGSVVFSIKKMLDPHFAVSTPYLAAVVKGTTFSVTVDYGSSRVQVMEGAVQVSNALGALALVRPGTIASAAAGDVRLLLTGQNARLVPPPVSLALVARTVGQEADSLWMGLLRAAVPRSAGPPELVDMRLRNGAAAGLPILARAAAIGFLVWLIVSVARWRDRRRSARKTPEELREVMLEELKKEYRPRRYGEDG